MNGFLRCVEDEVVALSPVGEVLTGVIDNVVSADGADQVNLCRAAPVTSASSALASCTAKVPTPPDAPMISTFCPACIWPWSRRAWRAVDAELGTAAA
jgi:hypothetical protein